jgi:MFS family permease
MRFGAILLTVYVLRSIEGSRLQDPLVLNLTATEVGLLGTIYIAGAVTGSLVFGILADRYGRKKLFIVTPAIYIVATLASFWSWAFWFLGCCIFFVGLGIGGEYSAMNSAINEVRVAH